MRGAWFYSCTRTRFQPSWSTVCSERHAKYPKATSDTFGAYLIANYICSILLCCLSCNTLLYGVCAGPKREIWVSPCAHDRCIYVHIPLNSNRSRCWHRLRREYFLPGIRYGSDADWLFKGFCLEFNSEIHTSCESHAEHSKTKSVTMLRPKTKSVSTIHP